MKVLRNGLLNIFWLRIFCFRLHVFRFLEFIWKWFR